MDLDEQLAALAAGELDDDTARALRARAATDPAIARRLARHRQLQRLLEDWDAPALSDAAVERLAARVDEALAALDDAPLADARVVGLSPQPLADPSDADGATVGAPGGAPATDDGRVVDLGEARRRRGLPSWLPGAAVAAALVAVVGTGIVLGGLPGGADLDTIAGDSAEEATDDAVQEESTDSPAEAELLDEGAARLEAEDTGAGPMRRSGIDLAEGDLLALVETEQLHATGSASTGSTNDDTAAGDDAAAGEDADGADQDAAVTSAPADAPCVTEALERDTEQEDSREVWLVGNGTYAGEPAVFVVIRTPATPEDRFEVLAYEPADCDLLARDETTA